MTTSGHRTTVRKRIPHRTAPPQTQTNLDPEVDFWLQPREELLFGHLLNEDVLAVQLDLGPVIEQLRLLHLQREQVLLQRRITVVESVEHRRVSRRKGRQRQAARRTSKFSHTSGAASPSPSSSTLRICIEKEHTSEIQRYSGDKGSYDDVFHVIVGEAQEIPELIRENASGSSFSHFFDKFTSALHLPANLTCKLPCSPALITGLRYFREITRQDP